MLTAKQIKSLPKGTFMNSDLQRKFGNHCVGNGLRPEFGVQKKGEGVGATFENYIKNRSQRRNRVK